MNDLISREALISRIESEYRRWGDAYDALQILGDIEDMSTINVTAQQWTPCRERLPQGGEEVLFATKTGRVYAGKYYGGGSGREWYSYKSNARAWNNVVVAWQSLPEPYVEGK